GATTVTSQPRARTSSSIRARVATTPSDVASAPCTKKRTPFGFGGVRGVAAAGVLAMARPYTPGAAASIWVMSGSSAQRVDPAAILGCGALMLVRWTGLLVPSLIRSIEPAFHQTDAGLGVFFFINALAYVVGSMGSGVLTERFGRRLVLPLATALIGIGLVGLAPVPQGGL